MKSPLRLILLIISAGILAACGYFAVQYTRDRVVTSRTSQFNDAMSRNDLSRALRQLLVVAETKGYRGHAVALARRFWIEINRNPDQEVALESKQLNAKTDSVMLTALELATYDIADTTEPVAADHLQHLAEEIIKPTLSQQKAKVLLAQLLMAKDDVKASVELLPSVADFDERIRKITPSAVLGSSLMLRRQFNDVIQLRADRLPAPKVPLSSDNETLLALEVMATRSARGEREAAALAKKYLDLNLFTKPLHVSEMRSVAGLDKQQKKNDEGTTTPLEPI